MTPTRDESVEPQLQATMYTSPGSRKRQSRASREDEASRRDPRQPRELLDARHVASVNGAVAGGCKLAAVFLSGAEDERPARTRDSRSGRIEPSNRGRIVIERSMMLSPSQLAHNEATRDAIRKLFPDLIGAKAMRLRVACFDPGQCRPETIGKDTP